jgi:hypothetical protein
MRGKIIAFRAAVTLAFLALAVPASVAGAAPASADSTVHPDNGPCRYQVVNNGTPVQENPDTNSVVRKYKDAGQYVTGPCRKALDSESGVRFTAVDCTCATDEIGWIRSYSLQ